MTRPARRRARLTERGWTVVVVLLTAALFALICATALMAGPVR